MNAGYTAPHTRIHKRRTELATHESESEWTH